MGELRDKVVKLAKENPELRKHLVPILKGSSEKTAEYAGMDPVEYGTVLAKLMKGLKRDTGATKIAQNYRGTGSQKMVRQLWVNWGSDGIDIWIKQDHLQFGGVLVNQPGGGSAYPIPRKIPYNNRTPQEVYREVVPVLKKWLGQ